MSVQQDTHRVIQNWRTIEHKKGQISFPSGYGLRFQDLGLRKSSVLIGFLYT